jgi:hypothetical protein
VYTENVGVCGWSFAKKSGRGPNAVAGQGELGDGSALRAVVGGGRIVSMRQDVVDDAQGRRGR